MYSARSMRLFADAMASPPKHPPGCLVFYGKYAKKLFWSFIYLSDY